ncbi:MAG: DNA repair protein RecO, partial [Moraxellaceae bacterium]
VMAACMVGTVARCELLVRLLPEMDAHEDIFESYQESLQQLNLQVELEPILRSFELRLLASLGYAIHFGVDAKSGLHIESKSFYILDVQQGFYLASIANSSNILFSGEHLLAIENSNFANTDVRLTAKRITRILLQPLLGKKPLMSRELFLS